MFYWENSAPVFLYGARGKSLIMKTTPEPLVTWKLILRILAL